jgi:arsenate reductase-like glutaredoxin family protein
MMMDNPNLIRRPVLVRGSRVTFGFDKKTYEKL